MDQSNTKDSSPREDSLRGASRARTTWRFFDPQAKIDITRRRLPHWEQPGVCYFLTFRTADSLPADVSADFRKRRHDWLLSQGIDTSHPDWHVLIGELLVVVQREYHKTWSREFHRLLDEGHGACHLAQPETAQIVVETLTHFDGARYDLGDVVIMPNHVHLLVQFREGFGMKKQCFSWKHYSSRLINLALNREGHFWQGETYDHIVRNAAEFEHYRRYIAENPVKAGLRSGFVVRESSRGEPSQT